MESPTMTIEDLITYIYWRELMLHGWNRSDKLALIGICVTTVASSIAIVVGSLAIPKENISWIQTHLAPYVQVSDGWVRWGSGLLFGGLFGWSITVLKQRLWKKNPPFNTDHVRAHLNDHPQILLNFDRSYFDLSADICLINFNPHEVQLLSGICEVVISEESVISWQINETVTLPANGGSATYRFKKEIDDNQRRRIERHFDAGEVATKNAQCKYRFSISPISGATSLEPPPQPVCLVMKRVGADTRRPAPAQSAVPSRISRDVVGRLRASDSMHFKIISDENLHDLANCIAGGQDRTATVQRARQLTGLEINEAGRFVDRISNWLREHGITNGAS
jgi:hypothetical protein